MIKKKTLKEQADQPGVIYATDPTSTEQLQEVSLDQKVDRYFIQYEREATGAETPMDQMPSKATVAVNENKKRTLKSWIFEQEDPAAGAEADTADAGVGDLGDDSGLGGDTPTPEAEPPVPIPKINVNLFASRLARLVSNYEFLLDPRTIILRRAQAYMLKNYSDKVAKELMTVMELQYNMTIKTKTQAQDSTPPAPIAVGAGMDGRSGGGGGEG